jgi:hypothetical protein
MGCVVTSSQIFQAPLAMQRHTHRSRYAIYGYYAAAVMACLGVFALYTRPDFLVTLANQVWACF